MFIWDIKEIQNQLMILKYFLLGKTAMDVSRITMCRIETWFFENVINIKCFTNKDNLFTCLISRHLTLS